MGFCTISLTTDSFGVGFVHTMPMEVYGMS
jgi:hypothetical protein